MSAPVVSGSTGSALRSIELTRDHSASRERTSQTADTTRPLSRARRLGLIVTAWTLLAAIPATSAYIVAQGSDIALWLRFFAPIVTYYYLWALITPLIYRMAVRLPFSGARATLTALAHAALLAAISLTMPFIVHFDNWRVWLYGANAVGFHAMSTFSYGFILLGCLSLKHYRIGVQRAREASEARLRAAQLDGQLSLAKIDALRMQINPHFLFNALNSIAALIETSRSEEAYRTTELLGALLRSALDQSRRALVPLRDELEFVSRYIEIERIRFGDRLRFTADIETGADEVLIPSLLLQPLVENAVKHAVAPSEYPVRIWVRARLAGTSVEIAVEDDGPGLPLAGPALQGGHGLTNTAERLHLRYGTAAALHLSDRSSGGTSVRLRFPREARAAD